MSAHHHAFWCKTHKQACRVDTKSDEIPIPAYCHLIYTERDLTPLCDYDYLGYVEIIDTHAKGIMLTHTGVDRLDLNYEDLLEGDSATNTFLLDIDEVPEKNPLVKRAKS